MSLRKCRLIGDIPLKEDVNGSRVSLAMLEFLEACGLEYPDQVAKRCIKVESGLQLNFDLEFYGYGGADNEEVSALARDISTIVEEEGRLTLLDPEAGDPAMASVTFIISAGSFRIEEVPSAADPAMQERHATLLEAMKFEGLSFQDCIKAFAAPNDDPFVAEARQQITGENDIAIDERTVTASSDSGEGAWVLNWMWIGSADFETRLDHS